MSRKSVTEMSTAFNVSGTLETRLHPEVTGHPERDRCAPPRDHKRLVEEGRVRPRRSAAEVLWHGASRPSIFLPAQ